MPPQPKSSTADFLRFLSDHTRPDVDSPDIRIRLAEGLLIPCVVGDDGGLFARVTEEVRAKLNDIDQDSVQQQLKNRKMYQRWQRAFDRVREADGELVSPNAVFSALVPMVSERTTINLNVYRDRPVDVSHLAASLEGKAKKRVDEAIEREAIDSKWASIEDIKEGMWFQPVGRVSARQHGEQAERIYGVVTRFVNECLAGDGSLLSADKSVWTRENCETLYEKYVEQNIGGTELNFEEKLEIQLETASDEVVQLMAEVVCVHFLIASSSTIRGSTKRKLINTILGWMERPVELPDEVSGALEDGFASAGTGFNTCRPFMLFFLVMFIHRWKGLDSQQRTRALNNPWEFRELVFEIDCKKSRSQRHALLHLVHPETFEPITSIRMKRQIASHLGEYVEDDSTNIDRKLQQIRRGLTEERNQLFEAFYDDDIYPLWNPEENPWHEFLEWAERIYDAEGFDRRERDYKLEIAENVRDAMEAVREDRPNWPKILRRAFGSPNNLTNWRADDDFLSWCEQSPKAARGPLMVLWDQERQLGERLREFSDGVPEEVVSAPGDRLSTASLLLMGCDPEERPFYKYTPIWRAFEMVDYEEPDDKSDEKAVYLHTLEFLDAFIEELADRDVEVRDRLDAQSLVWVLTRAIPDELDFLSEKECREFAEFRGIKDAGETDAWIFQASPDLYDLAGELQSKGIGDEGFW